MVDLIFALGPLFLVGGVGVPFALAGMALKSYFEAETVDGATMLFGGAAVVLGAIFVPPYVETWNTCNDLVVQISAENSVDGSVDASLIRLGLTPTPDTVTQSERDYAANQCEELPFI